MARSHKKLPARIIDPNTRVLTRQQQLFVEYYIDLGSAPKAAEKAGYADPRSAASVLTRHPLIVLEISECQAMMRAARRNKLLKRVELADITLERIMESSPAQEGKRRYQDHIEAAKVVYETAGLINQPAASGKKTPYYEDYSARSEAELEFFVQYGYFPENSESLEPARPGAQGRTLEGERDAVRDPGAAPGNAGNKPDPRQS